MKTRRDTTRPGFTLVELLVVMSIFAVLAIIAIPAFFRSGVFLQDNLSITANNLQSLLRAAKIHASTYHVNTAVVYMLDNYIDPETNPENTPGLGSPVIDSVTGENVRVIIGAAIMNLRPTGSSGACSDCYVPIDGKEGSFIFFPNETSILLRDCELIDPVTSDPFIVYDNGKNITPDGRRPRFDCEDNAVQDPKENCLLPSSTNNTFAGLSYLGMQDVKAIVGRELDDLTSIEGEETYSVSRFPAHVFLPSGQLDVQTSCEDFCTKAKERYVIMVAPSPSSPPESRLINTERMKMRILEQQEGENFSIVSNLVYIPIELFRASGRVRIAT